jgi:hypothetical protein
MKSRSLMALRLCLPTLYSIAGKTSSNLAYICCIPSSIPLSTMPSRLATLIKVPVETSFVVPLLSLL